MRYPNSLHNDFSATLMHIPRPAGWIEFDITEAVRNWKYSDPNYGVLLLATNEDALGRDTRFFSNAHTDGSRHAYVNVLCDDI